MKVGEGGYTIGAKTMWGKSGNGGGGGGMRERQGTIEEKKKYKCARTLKISKPDQGNGWLKSQTGS